MIPPQETWVRSIRRPRATGAVTRVRATRMYSGTTTTKNGTVSVAMTRPNSTPLPTKRKQAKA